MPAGIRRSSSPRRGRRTLGRSTAILGRSLIQLSCSHIPRRATADPILSEIAVPGCRRRPRLAAGTRSTWNSRQTHTQGAVSVRPGSAAHVGPRPAHAGRTVRADRAGRGAPICEPTRVSLAVRHDTNRHR